jgi:hypothetical protein
MVRGACGSFNQHRRRTGNQHIKVFGSRLGNIDNSGGCKRPPVVYLNRYLLVVMPVGNKQHRSKRQSWVGGGKKGGIKNFSRCRRATVKFRAIPGSNSLLPEYFTAGSLGFH